MIELPEAVSIARQLDETIKRKRIVEASTGDSPHKWVFYKPEREKLEKLLLSKKIEKVTSVARSIQIRMRPNQALVVDEFGGKVLYHEPDSKLPKKYHLFLKFDDNSSLTVAIQMWGLISTRAEWEKTKWVILRADGISPADTAFTLNRFNELIDRYTDKEKDSIKTFFTNGKSVAGIGNGYLQDILFRARISPRRKIVDITAEEKKALFGAVRETVKLAIQQNGRKAERDIFDKPGYYNPVMDRHATGKPCPNCGTSIKKISYLGGSCYICSECQN